MNTATSQADRSKADFRPDVAQATAKRADTKVDTAADAAEALRISGALQTTLEIDKIIEIFSLEANKLLPFDQIEFRAPHHGIEFSIGKRARHSNTYRLVLAGEVLGELTLSRKSRFQPHETVLIESLLCGLVYPVRNALLYKQALEAAHKDPLTGVGNRAAMNDGLARELELARRHNTPLSLLTLDIDHFKRINDSHGHAIGDCVIKAVAEAAQLTVRSTDMIFRFGGEEFVIVLSNTSLHGAALLAERLRKRIEETTIVCDGNSLCATVSIGIATMAPDDTPERLFRRADGALYQAKAEGRNCCRLASESNSLAS